MRIDCTRCGFSVTIRPGAHGYKVASYSGIEHRCPIVAEEMKQGDVDFADLTCDHLDLATAQAYDQWRAAAALDR